MKLETKDIEDVLCAISFAFPHFETNILNAYIKDKTKNLKKNLSLISGLKKWFHPWYFQHQRLAGWPVGGLEPHNLAISATA